METPDKMKHCLVIVATVAAVWINSSSADWTEARCDIYPKGEDHVSKMIPCTFGQRQGNVTITRDEGVHNGFSYRTGQLNTPASKTCNFLSFNVRC